LSDTQSGATGNLLFSTAPLAILFAVLVLLVVSTGLIVEVSLADFLVITCILGGAAAWMTGRAIALTWRPYRFVLIYMVLLTLAVRFIHFALFGGTLRSVHFFIVDYAVLAAIATLGYRYMRTAQMVTQYSWLYDKAGPLGWRGKGATE
jgi:hypothetical protein